MTNATTSPTSTTRATRESGWELWHDWHAAVMAPLTSWFCDAIAARPGMTVLDAACGTGIPSLAIAARVSPGGGVLAVDVSPIMVEAARRKAKQAGLSNLDVRTMSVSALEVESGSFDAVTCKDGLAYAEPLHGARELHRVLRAGGRVAVSTWDEPVRCPYFRTLFETLARFGAPPRPPHGPGPFRLSSPGALERVLTEAGFRNLVLERREVVFSFASLAQHWDIIRALSTTAAAVMARLDPLELSRLKVALADALAPYTHANGRVETPAIAICVRGEA